MRSADIFHTVLFMIKVFFRFSGKSHKHHETSQKVAKEKPKGHSRKTDHQKSKSEHEHAKQTLKLLANRHQKLNTPISVRLKQQVQQHVGKQKHILPVVPKKVPNRLLKGASKAKIRPQLKPLGRHGLAKPSFAARRPMQRIRIVYVPTNQSAASLVNQGPVRPLYKKPNGITPIVKNVQKQAVNFQSRAASSRTQSQQPYLANANLRVNSQGSFLGAAGGRSTAKSIDTARIFNEFPQLRASGVTAEIMNDLSKKVPNLEQRIQAHFKLHHVQPALYANSIHHDLAASNLAFMKNFHEAMGGQKPQQMTNMLAENRRFGGAQESFGVNNAINKLPVGQQVTKQAPPQDTVDRLQTLALENFQSTFMGKANPQNSQTNLQTVGQLPGYKTPSDLSLQRFRQENVPEVAYRSGNFDKQTNRPGLVFLPGNQISAYNYNYSTERSMPQVPRVQWQQNRLASFYGDSRYSNTWTAFTTCSSTCGRGMKKRYRKCEMPDCPSGGIEIETLPCIARPCAGMFYIVNTFCWCWKVKLGFHMLA